MIRGRAIRWFSDMNGQTFVPDTAAEVMQWIHDLPPQAPKMIRRAVRRRIMQEHTAHRVLRAHRDLKAHCQQKGVVFDDVPGPDVQAASIFPCHECCTSFSTVQGLNANRWKQHQRISQERSYVFTSTCLCCGRCFWTAQRLQQHIRYTRRHAKGCFWWLQKHIDPSTTSTPIDLANIHQGRFRLPWIRAHGPAPEPPQPLWERAHRDQLGCVAA